MPPAIETHRIVGSALDALQANGFEGLLASAELDDIVAALVNVEARLAKTKLLDVRLAVSGWIAQNQISRPAGLRKVRHG